MGRITWPKGQRWTLRDRSAHVFRGHIKLHGNMLSLSLELQLLTPSLCDHAAFSDSRPPAGLCRVSRQLRRHLGKWSACPLGSDRQPTDRPANPQWFRDAQPLELPSPHEHAKAADWRHRPTHGLHGNQRYRQPSVGNAASARMDADVWWVVYKWPNGNQCLITCWCFDGLYPVMVTSEICQFCRTFGRPNRSHNLRPASTRSFVYIHAELVGL